MRRAGLGVAFAATFSMLMFFCGPPPEPLLPPPGSPSEATPSRPTPLVPIADAEIDAEVHDGPETGRHSTLEQTETSNLGDKDAGPTPYGGGLNAEQIHRIVVAHPGALHSCFEIEAQRDPTLRGGVTVAWTIDASGAVITANVVGTTIHNVRVEGCIMYEVRRWQFPPSDGPSRVTFPFSFGIGR
jgi:hypothetical protein